jgi:hypothetical protein
MYFIFERMFNLLIRTIDKVMKGIRDRMAGYKVVIREEWQKSV